MSAVFEGGKKLEKKMRILDTAYQLFKTKSVAATAVDDVVKAAGIARGTFYLYFSDKSDLLEQMVMLKSTESMKMLLEEARIIVAKENLDFWGMCRIFLEKYIDFLVSHKDVLSVVQKSISSSMRALPEFYDDEIKETFDRITDMFEAEGYCKEDIHKTLYIAVDMVGSVCSDAILYGRPFGIEEIRPSVINGAMAVIKSGMKEEKIDENLG